MNASAGKKLFLRYGVLGGLLLDAWCGRPASAQEYKIIVNAANQISTMTKEQVSKIFLKKVTQWKNGKTVLPVDLVEASPVRVKFSEAIHGKTVSAVRAYWQHKIFSGRGIPPAEKASDAEVLAYVLENLEAIGYVSANATADKIKVLKITK